MATTHVLGGEQLTAQQVVQLPGEDRFLEADLEEVYRVGSFYGDQWAVFGRLFGVCFDESGHLYLMDDQAGRIVVVNQEGEFVREFGGIGGAPDPQPECREGWRKRHYGKHDGCQPGRALR